MSLSTLVETFIILWAVVDPIGTVPVFISATKEYDEKDRRKIAKMACFVAAGVLLFFIVVGEIILRSMGVELVAFKISGGIILFLFALTMIFGESKPDTECKDLRTAQDVAVFPLATPSIASPGAMMAVVLLTKNSSHSILEQTEVVIVMFAVIASAYGLMLASNRILKVIGLGGASIVSRVMGMVLASIAAQSVLEGIKDYF